MARRKTRRGKLIYAACLYVWGLALIAASIYALSRIWEYAAEYEASRPERAMQIYVANLSEQLWDEGIAETVAAMPHEVQSDEEVAVHVRELLRDGVSFARKGGGDGRAVYTLRCNGKAFGTVTLAEDPDHVPGIDISRRPWSLLPWSLKTWKVEKEEFDFNGLYSSVEVVVPETFSVWLNGVRLGEEYITETGIPFQALADYYKYSEDLPTKVRYRFDNVIGRLVPEIRDEDGEVFSIDRGKDDSQFIKPCSEEELARLAEFTAGFTANYLKYAAGVSDSTYAYQRLEPYLKPDSEMEQRMKGMLDGLSWAHTSSITVDSSRLNGALSLGGGFYVCDMTATATTFAMGKGQEVNVSNMRVFVEKKNDDVRAIALELY
ncbi:MAG: hypothetical protein K6F56_02985 [Oscillospiraceae bacterium]|nr:hypothetical protein [Oscillospiraceae bacterium]